MYVRDRSKLITFLRLLGSVLPGDRARTWVYLNLIAAPRRALRQCVNGFYRMDVLYDALREFKRTGRARGSILEFGTSDGYAFVKMLYATRYLGLSDRVLVHAFDSFEGLPPLEDEADLAVVPGQEWVEGQYRGRYEDLCRHCRGRYPNARIHKGWFEDTIDDEFLASLREHPPLLLWIDCDYYSSTKTVFERLLPYIPSGCIVYFDDYACNFGSRFGGEARLVHELNRGDFGDDVELVPDPALSLDSRSVYRFVRAGEGIRAEGGERENLAALVHHRTNDSPLP